MISAQEVTLAILAGGQGSRMGRPKALLEIDGQPILSYLLNRLAWKGPRWLITAPGNQHPPGAAAFDREYVDPHAVPAPGPLRGVLTALENLQTPMLVVTTVDMPLIGPPHLQELLNKLALTRTNHGLMFQRSDKQGNRIVEPFPLALRHEALAAIRDSFATGRRSVRGLLDSPHFATTSAPDSWHVWANLNTPADLEGFLHNHRSEAFSAEEP